ncbi:MAG: hypothetical protein GOMPHAMPRED_004911 [Gomphillus americanus]|uniref:Protein CASP n=1 Tax=Gomphillus americanus TaxID=1940652 RepID=A0A8H3I818_9LECA|nr:MAG: hypothetical protein GOMPHAMPRED_004911 [Gomphillus americanus]
MDLSAEQEGNDNVVETPAVPELTMPNGDDTSSSEHQFQKAISTWRTIDLSNLISDLDGTAAEVVDNQKDALVQRKDLAQKTKDFRKLDDESKLVEWKTLLKSYQTFIDLLTTHGKTTSTAFLQLYSTISDAPDPYPLLQASVDSLLVSEDTVPKLNSENEQLQRTVRNLTRDLELAESQLQQERTLRKKLEESQQTNSKTIEASWQAVLDEKRDNWEAKEKALEEKLENQDRLFNELKAGYEVAQRLNSESGSSSSAQVTASAAELEMMSADLERTSQRLAEMEARNEQLRTDLAQATSTVPKRSNIEDDPAYSRLRSENSALLRKLDAAKLEKESQTGKLDTRVKTLERDIRSLQQEKELVQSKLLNWADYPELKRELDIFKAIELSSNNDDEEDAEADGEDGNDKKSSLEQMLLARNKKVSSELAILRVSYQELKQEMDNLQDTLSRTNADLERAQNLNATLENDLLNLQQEASNAFPMSAKSVSSRYPTSATIARSPYAPSSITPRRASPTSSIISGFDSNRRSPFGESLDSLRASDAVGGGSGILPMVQAQRDRFKQKNAQLEAELQKQYNTVSSLRQEISALQKDNLNLYEKTRYVSTYQRNSNAASGSAYSANPSGSIQMPQDASGGLDRYRSAYEANISPFAQFRGREAARAYKRMSLPERMIYSVTRMVLASRTSRNLFAVYCVVLHVLVFLMLYWMQTTDVEKHAVHLGQSAAAVMGAAAGPVGAEHGDWHQEGLNHGKPDR